MPSCCYPDEYAEFFSEKRARREARALLRRGLRGTARLLADRVEAAGVRDAVVLEVGGGVGGIQAELLGAGAERAVNVELSPGWERPAAEVIAARNLAGRVERRIGDFVDVADELPDADVVVLHRVLCCYPDWEAMLGAGLRKATRVVGFTVPVNAWWNRLVVRVGNRFAAWRGRDFRAFVHPPGRMVRTLADAGFTVRTDERGVVWRTIVAERAAA